MKKQTNKDLLEDLIAIPSYLRPSEPSLNENAVVDYLERWVTTNTDFGVERQPLPGGRYNLIVKSGTPKTLFLAHTDTVPPASDSAFNQLIPAIKQGALYGRGATDMKSGIVSLLVMLINPVAKNKNFWIVFYADEEYDFLGMREFIAAYPNLKPELLVSADGSDLQLGFGCRGLIELSARIVGKTGHPGKGTKSSAILGMARCIGALEQLIQRYSTPALGSSILNVAYILGGQTIEESFAEGKLVAVGKQANVVPDICEAVIEIRTADAALTAKRVLKRINTVCTKLGLKLELAEVRHDLGAMISRPKQLAFLESLNEVGFTRYSKANMTGYLDMQMAWEKYGQPPAVMFGSGIGASAHTNQEHIRLADLERGQDFFTVVINKIG